MNYRVIAHALGLVLKLESACMIAPMAVSLFYRELVCARGFFITAVVLAIVSVPLGLVKREKSKLYAKESFLIVAISWICISAFGALPFYLSGEIPQFIDCLFESISGFTTTGAAVSDVEALSRGLLFWKSFSQWIGGMGVLIFLMAVIPAMGGDRSIQMMKAEAPGPAPGKLVPKMRHSSMILYIIYLSLTVVEAVILVVCGMPLFDSVINAMSTTATGGVSPRHMSVAAYGNPACEVVITVFMILSGINFNMFFLMLGGNFKSIFKSDELRMYFIIIGISVAAITWNTVGAVYPGVGEALRHAVFQVGSTVTTTGFSASDISMWPGFSKVVLFILMFVGGCSGSTACGIKVSRLMIMFRELRCSVYRIIRPRSVGIVRLDGKAVDAAVVQGVCNYGVLCMFIFFITLAVVSLDNHDLETSFSAAASCLNNVGIGFGKLVNGASFADFSVMSKLVLSMNMLLGRLEIYPILLLLSPRTWQRG